jgi:hypothetical protein
LIVRIEHVDLARRQLEFRLEKVTHHAEPATLAPRRGGKPKEGGFKSKDPRRKPSGRDKSPTSKKRRRP